MFAYLEDSLEICPEYLEKYLNSSNELILPK